MKKMKIINVPESILLVSTFFMFIFIYKFLVFIPEFRYLFERGTLWFAFPLITLIIAIHSFVTRDV